LKEFSRKIIHFLVFYPIYYYIWFFFLGNIFLDNVQVLTIILFYFLFSFIDVLLRPISDPDEITDRYTIILLNSMKPVSGSRPEGH